MTTTTQEQPVVRQLFNTPQASAYLGGTPSPNTLAQWRSQGGRGPKFVKLGKLVRYERATLDAWLAANTHTGTGNTGAQSY